MCALCSNAVLSASLEWAWCYFSIADRPQTKRGVAELLDMPHFSIANRPQAKNRAGVWWAKLLIMPFSIAKRPKAIERVFFCV